MLSNFQLGSHPLLQTLLLGQPEFRATLQGHAALEQLRQRVIATHHLEAMERGEVEPYIVHRLELVGWNGNPQFDQRVFAELYAASGGIPRRVNQIANRLLLLGAVEQRTRIDCGDARGGARRDGRRDARSPRPRRRPMPTPEPTVQQLAPLRHEPRDRPRDARYAARRARRADRRAAAGGRRARQPARRRGQRRGAARDRRAAGADRPARSQGVEQERRSARR